MSNSNFKLILASGSPRRRSLLEACGLQFEVRASDAPEERSENESPKHMAERLALLKAELVARQCPDAYVIGCDTDVCVDNQILGKPKDENDACRLLSLIQGRTHSVWGAFAVIHRGKQVAYVHSDETKVTMAPMTAAMIRAYVATGEPMDKAGAYAAQGIGAQFIEAVSGSYTNVVGLNVCTFMQALRDLKIIHDDRS